MQKCRKLQNRIYSRKSLYILKKKERKNLCVCLNIDVQKKPYQDDSNEL